MPVSLRPTADEYEAFFSLPGPEGGIAAQRIQWQFEYDDVQQYAIEPPMPDMNMIHRRKGVPDKSVPSELWALLCFPNRSKTGLVTKGGIGQDTEKMRTNDFHRLKRGLHIQIRRCAATPMAWHRAKCVGCKNATTTRACTASDASMCWIHLAVLTTRASHEKKLIDLAGLL